MQRISDKTHANPARGSFSSQRWGFMGTGTGKRFSSGIAILVCGIGERMPAKCKLSVYSTGNSG